MANPISPKIQLIPEVEQILKRIISSGKSQKRYVERGQIILRIAQGGSNMSIGKEMKKNFKTIKKWRLRYLSSELGFDKILSQEDKTAKQVKKELEAAVYELLNDKPRPGGPMKFTAEQYCRLMEIALRKPDEFGRPINDWTPRELTEEAIKQGIFPSISVTQVANFLKRSRPKTASGSLLAQSQC